MFIEKFSRQNLLKSTGLARYATIGKTQEIGTKYLKMCYRTITLSRRLRNAASLARTCGHKYHKIMYYRVLI